MITPNSSQSTEVSTVSRPSTIDTPRLSPHATAMQVVDRLHRADPNTKLPLPTVAVAGGQSAGKSSFLSALLDVPLHSDVDTATFAPTEIHSRQKNAPFAATIYIECSCPTNQNLRRLSFNASPIANKEDLLKALRWAGNEARRLQMGLQLRTYEQLCNMVLEEILRGEERWIKFTANKVILWAEGPDQRDMSAIDLPGLGSKHDTEIKELYESVLRREECLVILVMAMSGDDPQEKLPLFEIVKHIRPRFQSVLGILTKADLAQKIARSAWGKLILGSNEAMKPIDLQHGFHPVFLKSADMYDDRVSKDAWLKKQELFFAGKEMMRFASECKRALGWVPTSEKIYKLFADLVQDQIPVIKNHIMLGLERNRQEVAKLPPKVVDPSSFLHDKVIAPISRELQISFERRRSYAQKLLAPLERLKKNLADSIQSSFPLGAVKVREDKENHLFTTIHDKLNEYRNVRDGSHPDVALAVHELLKPCLLQWSALATEANVSAWSALDSVIVAAVKRQIADRPRVFEQSISALHRLHESHKTGVNNYISRIMAKELARQDLIQDDAASREERAKVVDQCEAEFDAYCDLFDDNMIDLTDDTELTPRKLFLVDMYPEDSTSPGKWPRAYRKLCIETAMLVHHRLTSAARRVHEELLREINYRMLEFMEETPACLRRSFELDEVTVERKRKLVKICDVDHETAAKRAKLEDEGKSLRELENLMHADLE